MAIEDAPSLSSAASGDLEQTLDVSLSSPGAAEGAPGGGSAEPALFAQPAPTLSPQDDVDFILHPVELAKGRRAAENHLSTFRSEETRKTAEEALETLATVISGGKCDTARLSLAAGSPLPRCRRPHDPEGEGRAGADRNAAMPPRLDPQLPGGARELPPRQVQKIRSTLSKVIEEATELGFVGEEEESAAPAKTAKRRKSTSRSTSQARLLADGELRALVAASAADNDAAGRRDAVLFCFVHRGLKIAEITTLTPESIKFSNKTGLCTIVAKPRSGGGRGRRIELSNDELILLEDWLDDRGDGAGPLLCTVGRASKIEGKRLTTATLKTICEARAEAAEVQPFTPNDLSRSAEALESHRKAAKRKAARAAAESLSEAEQALYLSSSAAENEDLGETIQFPFLGLDH